MVMSGTVLSQVIGFAISPLISRLFSPSDFGISGSFGAVWSVIAAGATLEYSQAIMLPKEKENAINLLAVSFFCTFSLAFLCLAVCLSVPGAVNGIMKTRGAWALVLLVLATMVSGSNQACQAWAVRRKAFKHTSGSQVIRSVTMNGSRVGLGVIKAGGPGLIVSAVLADVAASINLVRVLIPDIRDMRSRIRWSRMKLLAREYHDFPLYSASQNVINALSNGLPVLLLSRFYGIDVAGAFAFAANILQTPMGFVLTALRQVLFQKACENQHQGGSLAQLYVKTTAVLFGMALLPTIVMIIWAPQFFVWVFGSRWNVAGELARSLIIWLAVVFCNLPAVLFARIIRIQRFVFFYDIALLAGRSLALVLGGRHLSAPKTVLLFALVGAFMNVFLIIRVGRSVLKKEGAADLNSLRDLLIKE